MLRRFKNMVNLIQNMGWRYVRFRGEYELLRRSGMLKARFPIYINQKKWLNLDSWKLHRGTFFFRDRADLVVPKHPSLSLEQKFNDYLRGNIIFFNSLKLDLGNNYDWVTNPESGYHYDVNKHWTEVEDYVPEAGDIKFVWEKSRFSFLYDIIRYDYHFNNNNSKIVFKEILSWIKSNPVNRGPNYRCSQEISLRVLNWIFALYYYSDALPLTDKEFDDVQNAIYWQIHHVYHNINFSRIAVRNNHAITESLTLWLVSLLFPTQPDFKQWGDRGKKWFEEEVAYQIYEDGTFLQFSMNYHRVLIQLLTWGIHLAELNEDKLADVVYDRATKSLYFLRACMDDGSGWLPNYGANDGALFFKLNDDHYRDYRPQLNALAQVLRIDAQIGKKTEDAFWYKCNNEPIETLDMSSSIHRFINGGYYIIRDGASMSFIRCGSHKDRPSQADNFHLDIWYKGQNFLIDSGSYKYNTDIKLLKYFMGTESHNTIMVDGEDQMLKGGRFIWYKWTQCQDASLDIVDDIFVFKGTISAFQHIHKDIRHQREVIKVKGKAEWIIRDTLINIPPGLKITQLWHMPDVLRKDIIIQARDGNNEHLSFDKKSAFYSGFYGQKESSAQLSCVTYNHFIETIIKIEPLS